MGPDATLPFFPGKMSSRNLPARDTEGEVGVRSRFHGTLRSGHPPSAAALFVPFLTRGVPSFPSPHTPYPTSGRAHWRWPVQAWLSLWEYMVRVWEPSQLWLQPRVCGEGEEFLTRLPALDRGGRGLWPCHHHVSGETASWPRGRQARQSRRFAREETCGAKVAPGKCWL